MHDLDDMTDTELANLAQAVEAEQESRRLDERLHEMNVTALTKADVHRGQAWEQPTSAASAYPKGWTLPHKGKDWVSLLDGNVWEPSITGWREVSGDEPPQWIQPMGAHDSYAQGDKVSQDGEHYSSRINGNVWAPSPTSPYWNHLTAEVEDPLLWAAGQDVETGNLRIFDDIVYRAKQAHTTQEGWEPPNTPALWEPKIEEEQE